MPPSSSVWKVNKSLSPALRGRTSNPLEDSSPMTHARRPRFSSHFPQGANHFSATMWKPNVHVVLPSTTLKTVEPLICSGVFQSRDPFPVISKCWIESKQPSFWPSRTLLQYFSWTLWILTIWVFVITLPRYAISDLCHSFFFSHHCFRDRQQNYIAHFLEHQIIRTKTDQ